MRLSLQQIRAVDCEQRLALLHIVPNRGIKGDDPPLVGREHLRRHVLVEIDAPDRFFLDRERTLCDRLDFDCGELRIRQINTIAIALGRRRPIALLGVGDRRTKLGMRALTQAPSAISHDGYGYERANEPNSRAGVGHVRKHEFNRTQDRKSRCEMPITRPSRLLRLITELGLITWYSATHHSLSQILFHYF